MPLIQSTHNSAISLQPGNIYLLLYIRDVDIAQGFHWALYHHYGERGGYKFNIKNFGGSGWICDSGPIAKIMSGFLLNGALRIGYYDPDCTKDLMWIDRVDLSALPSPYDKLTCRTWTLHCVRGLVKQGVVLCENVDALEEEAIEWGAAHHKAAHNGEQPRPVADAFTCTLGRPDSESDIPRQPLFPAKTPLIACPSVGSLSPTWKRRLFFYIHEHVLKPVSRCYCRYWGIHMDPRVYPLPFGFLLKEQPRLREQEGLAMNLARSMAIPAPMFVSFGEPPPNSQRHTTILMFTIPGTLLSELNKDLLDMDVIYSDLRNILAQMRSYINPRGDRICGVDGGPVRGHFIPASPMPPHKSEEQFHDFIRSVASAYMQNPAYAHSKHLAEQLFALPPHAIVFTHGDFNEHNIMVGADGRISGIIDWENAAWLPEYWEFAVPAVLEARAWGRVMDKTISGGTYSDRLNYCRAVFNLTADSFEY